MIMCRTDSSRSSLRDLVMNPLRHLSVLREKVGKALFTCTGKAIGAQSSWEPASFTPSTLDSLKIQSLHLGLFLMWLPKVQQR